MRADWSRWAGPERGGRPGRGWPGWQQWFGGHEAFRGPYGGPGGPGRGGPGGPGGPRGRGGPDGPWGGWGRGGWGPGGSGGWDPGRWRGRMERGVLRYILLAALKDGPKHGYQMIKWLEERSHGFYSPSPGTIYPTLQYLEDQGLVRAENQEERRVYHLTDAGRAELEAHGGMVEAVIERFSRHVPGGAAGGAAGHEAGHEAGFLKAELHDLMRTVQEGVGAMRQGDEATVRRVRQAVERCKNEVRDIIARGTGSPPAAPAAPGGAGGPAPGLGEAPTAL